MFDRRGRTGAMIEHDDRLLLLRVDDGQVAGTGEPEGRLAKRFDGEG